MSDWIEECANKREANTKRDAAINRAAPQVWKSLRSHILNAARQYEKRFPPNNPPHDSLIFPPDGFPDNEFTIEVMQAKNQDFEQEKRKRKVIVSFDQNANTISAKHSDGKSSATTALNIGVNAAGTVVLLRAGQEITVEDAAREILMPLLFPDIQ